MSNALPGPIHLPWLLPPGLSVRVINGYPMCYQDFGFGTPLLFVHGAMTDYRYWDFQVPAFSRDYRVLVAGLRHYYPEKWDAKSNDFSIEQHAQDIAELVGSLGLGKVHLVGHSRGGAVALHVARTHPEVIRTLTLADPSGAETLLPQTVEGGKMAAELSILMEGVRRTCREQGDEAASIQFVDALNGPGSWQRRTPEERQRTIDNIGTVIGDPATRPAIDCDVIKRFDFPVLLLTGARSPQRYGDMMNAMLKCNSALPKPVVVPDAAHPMNRENQAFFDQKLHAFLAGH